MTEEIPPNFDKPWFDSDVILLTENAEDKKLYANKVVLSVFSPVMRAMLNGGFKEAIQEAVEIHFDYKAMMEILRIIFQVGHPYSLEEQKEYDANILMEMYKAADFFDISIVRKICIDQMRFRPSVDMAFVAMEVDLHEILMEMLTENLQSSELEEFLSRESSHRRFSKKDVAVIYKTLTQKDVKDDYKTSSELVNLKDVAPKIEKPRIDLTKKMTLASVSEYFRDLFFDENMASKELTGLKEYDERCDCIFLDYDYTTVKMILSIHHCNADYMSEESINYHPAPLYDMYCAAAKDHLDMPSIQSFCVTKLLKRRDFKGLDVAVKLNLDIQETYMNILHRSDLKQWITAVDKMLAYRDGDKVIEISSRQDDSILTLNHLRIVIKKLRTPVTITLATKLSASRRIVGRPTSSIFGMN